MYLSLWDGSTYNPLLDSLVVENYPLAATVSCCQGSRGDEDSPGPLQGVCVQVREIGNKKGMKA